jgi:hypothetical protein
MQCHAMAAGTQHVVHSPHHLSVMLKAPYRRPNSATHLCNLFLPVQLYCELLDRLPVLINITALPAHMNQTTSASPHSTQQCNAI